MFGSFHRGSVIRAHAGLIHGSVPYYMYVGSWSVRVSGRCLSVFEFFVSTPQFERGRISNNER